MANTTEKPAAAPKETGPTRAEFDELKKRVAFLERANDGRKMIRGDD